ncbi:MAG: hypothetical protein OEN20_00775 [Gammaproteobacteria bacterium]|nr:hypothetical protein [Gammaproteobacteria bacterium]
MAAIQKPPSSFWQTLCERTSVPLACVREDGCFLWVNFAWSRLTLYSQAELVGRHPGAGMKIQDLHGYESVGVEAESTKRVVSGVAHRAISFVSYERRDATQVSVIQTMLRHPAYGDPSNFLCLAAEALENAVGDSSVTAISEMLDRQKQEIAAQLQAVTQRLARVEEMRQEEEQMGSKSSNSTNVNIGSLSTGWIVTIVVTLIVVVGFLGFYLTYPLHHGDAPPPPTWNAPAE